MVMVQRGCESNGTKGGDLPARLLITILIPSTCRGEMRPTLINSLPRVREICNHLERKRERAKGEGEERVRDYPAWKLADRGY